MGIVIICDSVGATVTPAAFSHICRDYFTGTTLIARAQSYMNVLHITDMTRSAPWPYVIGYTANSMCISTSRYK